MLYVSETTDNLKDNHACTGCCSRYISGRTSGRRNIGEDAAVHARAIIRAHPCWVRGYTDGSNDLDPSDVPRDEPTAAEMWRGYTHG
jgi:hypothetical protein